MDRRCILLYFVESGKGVVCSIIANAFSLILIHYEWCNEHIMGLFGCRRRCLNPSQLVSSSQCISVSVVRGFVRILHSYSGHRHAATLLSSKGASNDYTCYLLFAYLILELPQFRLTQLYEIFWYLACTIVFPLGNCCGCLEQKCRRKNTTLPFPIKKE